MNQWLRLWHDMPTDPKFRTVARQASQPLAAVIAVYVYMLTDASANAAERGRTQANDENVASALDLSEGDVSAIREAMQGRLLHGNIITGWEKRQPKREDNSAARAKAWREERKSGQESERSRTHTNARKRPDKDTDIPPKSPKGDPLPIVQQGDPIVPFLAKVRGKEIIFGTRGTVTATPDEMERAKALAGAA